MCLCILVHQWLEDTPLIMAANREEHYDRPSLLPAWRPDGLFAGSDQRQGGTWQGLNARGLLVALTNRKGTIQDPSRRSRGLLCQDALQSASARSSVEWLFDHFSRQLYNPCNLLIADAREAFAIHYDGHQASMQILNPGLHLLADTDVDDPMHPRIQQARALLEELPADWPTLRDMLESVMADHDKNLIPSDHICIHGERAGTLSSSIVALCERNLNQAEFHFADGPPCAKPYANLSPQLNDYNANAD